MKKILLSFLLLATLKFNAQVTVTPITNNNDLINYLQGYGLTITTITVTAAPNSLVFYSGTSPMAFGSGVLMTTGEAGTANGNLNGPSGTHLSVDQGLSGDSDLNLVSGFTTYDACIIEFDCIPQNPTISFDFAFGSEEYNDYVGSGVNDAFAIFASGNDTDGVPFTNRNLALLPGTTIPISINTVNNGNAGGMASGPCANCQYYIDNFGGSSLSLDGHTVGLNGSLAVNPGQTYHFKIGIADGGDHIYDSQAMFVTNCFRSLPPVGLNETSLENDMIFFPNPADDKIYFENNKDLTKVVVLSIDGKIIKSMEDADSINSMDIKELPAGIYFINLFTKSGITNKKLVIE